MLGELSAGSDRHETSANKDHEQLCGREVRELSDMYRSGCFESSRCWRGNIELSHIELVLMEPSKTRTSGDVRTREQRSSRSPKQDISPGTPLGELRSHAEARDQRNARCRFSQGRLATSGLFDLTGDRGVLAPSMFVVEAQAGLQASRSRVKALTKDREELVWWGGVVRAEGGTSAI